MMSRQAQSLQRQQQQQQQQPPPPPPQQPAPEEHEDSSGMESINVRYLPTQIPTLNPFARTFRHFIVREMASHDPPQPTIAGLWNLRGREQGVYTSFLHTALSSLVARVAFEGVCRTIYRAHCLLSTDPVDLDDFYKRSALGLGAPRSPSHTLNEMADRGGAASSGSDADNDDDSDHTGSAARRRRAAAAAAAAAAAVPTTDASLLSAELEYERARRFAARLTRTSMLLGGAIGAAVLHPLSVVMTWQMTHLPPLDAATVASTTLEPRRTISAYTEYCRIASHASKSFYDGLTASLVARALESWLASAIMPLVEQCIPALAEPKSVEPVIKAESFKRMLILIVRRLSKMTVLSTVTRYITQAIVFPLLTVRYRLEAQGSSFLTPMRYDDTLDCVTSIYREEGVPGFYKGIAAHLLSIFPDLVFTGITYAGLVLLVEYLYHESKLQRAGSVEEVAEEDQDDDDDDEGDDDDDDDDDGGDESANGVAIGRPTVRPVEMTVTNVLTASDDEVNGIAAADDDDEDSEEEEYIMPPNIVPATVTTTTAATAAQPALAGNATATPAAPKVVVVMKDYDLADDDDDDEDDDEFEADDYGDDDE